MAYLSTTQIGAKENGNQSVMSWSTHIYDAFLAGAWILFWTDKTLLWVAKPTVHIEIQNGSRRLHNDHFAALESDVENLYFWHGVMVPAFVIVRPDWITIKHIETEDNAEVRRVMIERYGQARYLVDSGAMEIHRDDFGILYRKEIPNDEPLMMVKVVNSTAEPDGHFKDYHLRVNPELRPLLDNSQMGEPQALTALNAVASTFGKRGEEYDPCFES